jgi:hypothetical protein
MRPFSLSLALRAALIAVLLAAAAIVVIAACSRAEPMSAPTPPPNAVRAVWSDRFVSSVGIGTHFSYTDLLPYGNDRAKTVASLIASGARFARDGLTVSVTDDSNDPYWNTMAELTHAGMKLVLVTYPTHLRGGAIDSPPYRDQRPLDTAVARVGAGNILAFEGPNEVDNNNESWGGKDVYGTNARAYQRAMYTHSKQIAPSIAVLALTTTTAAGAAAVGDLSSVMDAGTLHPYPDADVPMAHLESTKHALAALNAANKPWWVTETGYYTAPNATENVYQPGVSDAAQAKYIARIYLDYFNAGIPHTSVYELIDERDDRANAESNYGIMFNDGTPKPAYGALKNLLTLLADRGDTFEPGSLGFSLSGTTSTIRQALFQKRDGRFYLVLWNDVPVYEPKRVGGWQGRARRMWERFAGVDTASIDLSNAPVIVSIALTSAARTLTVYAPLKGSAPLISVTGKSSLPVPVPDYPVVVEITP